MLKITAKVVSVLEDRLWELEMPPNQVRLFGASAKAIGSRSVLLLKSFEFDDEAGELSFAYDDATALNVGTSNSTVAVSASLNPTRETTTEDRRSDPKVATGPGDAEFLRLAAVLLPEPMQRASRALLDGVRLRSSGDLKRGKSKNFSNTPDNFWYVIVQPRVEQLSITVRGPVEHFKPVARLPIKDDRGNTLFKVTREEDVPAALDLIFFAKRKREE